MLILVDEGVAGAGELFAEYGVVRLFEGRRLTREDVRPADALITRSITPVDRDLLDGSGVRFVGTTSSGHEQVDTEYLRERGIVFASAAGCNAVTVSQYVFAACMLLGERFGFDVREKSLGIVGVGRIGSLVRDWAGELGMRVLLCDPPRARTEGGREFVDLSGLAREADIITLHVPLVRDGRDATENLLGEEVISACKDGLFLINTSRGNVLDENAILRAKSSGRIGGMVLDVWRGEPRPRAGMVDAATIATPHIAGQSQRARVRAAKLICDALGKWLGKTPPRAAEDPVAMTEVDVPSGAGFHGILREAARHGCDLGAMDSAFRGLPRDSDGLGSFDGLRKALADRREIRDFRFNGLVDEAARRFIALLGGSQ